MTVWEEWEGMDQMQFTQLTQINERSSADSLFRKGDAKLYPFHFGQHLVLVSCKQELSDKTQTDERTKGQCSNLHFAPALNEPLRNNKVAYLSSFLPHLETFQSSTFSDT